VPSTKLIFTSDQPVDPCYHVDLPCLSPWVFHPSL